MDEWITHALTTYSWKFSAYRIVFASSQSFDAQLLSYPNPKSHPCKAEPSEWFQSPARITADCIYLV